MLLADGDRCGCCKDGQSLTLSKAIPHSSTHTHTLSLYPTSRITSELELYTLALLLKSVIESLYKQSHYLWHYICVNLRSVWELYKVCSHTLWGTDHLYSSHIYHHLPASSIIYQQHLSSILYQPLSASTIIYHHLSSSISIYHPSPIIGHPWVYQWQRNLWTSLKTSQTYWRVYKYISLQQTQQVIAGIRKPAWPARIGVVITKAFAPAT